MRTYELRTYTLSTREAFDRYRTVHYPRHLTSFALHGVGLHGLWAAADGSLVLHALISYTEGLDPKKFAEQFMLSDEFRADMDGFDSSAIVGVTTTLLEPSAGSPLL
ncbi:hypothetical protein [Streptomyces sp. NPDC048663]|uniref:hypothetical protein n=1 Tax=Streptomyces sp. NPDC048663 TaxID=3155638 RepID=UPI00342CAE3F